MTRRHQTDNLILIDGHGNRVGTLSRGPVAVVLDREPGLVGSHNLWGIQQETNKFIGVALGESISPGSEFYGPRCG